MRCVGGEERNEKGEHIFPYFWAVNFCMQYRRSSLILWSRMSRTLSLSKGVSGMCCGLYLLSCSIYRRSQLTATSIISLLLSVISLELYPASFIFSMNGCMICKYLSSVPTYCFSASFLSRTMYAGCGTLFMYSVSIIMCSKRNKERLNSTQTITRSMKYLDL